MRILHLKYQLKYQEKDCSG